jgi:triosephosphate isomerase
VARTLDGSTIKLGAQNLHPEASGAFTGEISAPMLRALFTTHVILGHSERRSLFGEKDAFINQKVLAALKHQMRPILCVGETLAEREGGSTLKVVQTQLEAGLEGVSREQAAGMIVAYEPVWAIGTGKTPTSEDIKAMHAHIRACLVARLGESARALRILYGGSVKADNAAEILNLAEVNGALVGGASLKAEEFQRIVRSVKEA